MQWRRESVLRNRASRLSWCLPALWILAFVWGTGCKDDCTLLLTVSAESRVDTFDLTVLVASTKEPLLELIGEPVDSEDPTRDISQTGQELRLALIFDRPGSYLVHLVGRSMGPRQVYTQVVRVDGTVKRNISLVLLAGMDGDEDGFISEAACLQLNSPSINCQFADCDDLNPAIHPLAEEICGNGIDEDCDGEDRPCIDADGDGSPENEDCDDNDPDRFPGNPEAPNSCPTAQYPSGLADPRCDDGIDQDCDGQDTACIVDADCDGSPAAQDCNDNDPNIHPGANEICGNGIDENCNNVADEGCVNCDLDGDGFQRDDVANGCPDATYPNGQEFDCDDTDAGVFPGLTASCGDMEGGDPACAAYHLCDGKDNDCDGEVDEGCPPPNCDLDGDGFQNTTAGCNPLPGMVDCDDSTSLIYPGAPDRCGDGILQNCNTDTACDDDGDGDGYNAAEDCNDSNPLVNPAAQEVCNGVDDDCDGLVDEGNPDHTGAPMADIYCNDDNDGLCGVDPGPGICVCTKVTPNTMREEGNRVTCPGENLSAAASARCVFAPQPEIEQCDPLDHDCNGVLDDPTGDDLFETGQPCGPETGACAAGVVLGCDFSQTTYGAFNEHFLCGGGFIGPIPEMCNGIDDDCSGSLPSDEEDHDNDDYIGCSGCQGLTMAPGLLGCDDCAQWNAGRHPNNLELCNNVDDDCVSGLGNDGADECFGSTPNCCGSLGICVNILTDVNHCGGCGANCSSMRANLCSNGNCRCGTGSPCDSGQQCVGSGTGAYCDCNSTSCPDGCCSGIDCVVFNSQTNNTCGDGGDPCGPCPNNRDCDGGECLCFGQTSPPAESNCGDNTDNDCDGSTDCTDSDCNGDSCGPDGMECSGGSCLCSGNGGTVQGSESSCSDGHDNDCDGATDCADSNCNGDSCGSNGMVCSGGSCVCSGNGGTAQSSESSCGDTHDNDCDGAIDCADSNCSGDSCGPDGMVCSGGSCLCSGNGGTAQSSESSCADGHDNDCDGDTDCADSTCTNGTTCGPDGMVCSGSSCVCSGNGGTAQGSESSCADGHDNDCDGDTDCADSNCNNQSCGGDGEVCTGGFCICPGGLIEHDCDDGDDNNCNGLTDCDDPDCAGIDGCPL